MKFKLEEAYEIVFRRKPFFQQKNKTDVYINNVIWEQVFRVKQVFGINNAETKITAWGPLENKLYSIEGKTGAGPGEYSVAATIIKQNDPELYKALEAPTTNEETVIDILQNLVQGGNVPYDIKYNDNKYEVKQTSEISSVRTGVNAKDLAANIFLGLKEEINQLYKKYRELPEEYKKLLGEDVRSILTASYEYLKTKNIELAQGALFPLGGDYGLKRESHSSTPKMHLLPSLLENILKTPHIKHIISPTAEEIKNVYGIDLFDAKVIDIKVRDYLSSCSKLKAEIEPPETLFNDFLLLSRLSSFANEEVFNKNIRRYFIPGTEKHKEALKTVFPETGLFVVSPQGYIYVGRNRLDSIIRVTRISGGTLKIALYRKGNNA
jgi:hypothetical protein